MTQVVAGFSLWRPGFNPRPVHLGVVFENVALGQLNTKSSQQSTALLNKMLKSWRRKQPSEMLVYIYQTKWYQSQESNNLPIKFASCFRLL